jgi:tRNA(Ile2) C34 agmatinyltransferase TiaS
MSRFTTVAIPEELTGQVYAVVLDSLLTQIETQKAEIEKLMKATNRAVRTNTTTLTHRYPAKRRYKSYHSRVFAGYIANTPQNVRTEAKVIRDQQGYKQAVEFLMTWWTKNGKKAKSAHYGLSSGGQA